MKDHQIAMLVNDIRDIAVKYHDFQCLRELIHSRLVPEIQSLRAQLEEANCKLQESERENKYLRFGVYEELNIAISAALSSKGKENG